MEMFRFVVLHGEGDPSFLLCMGETHLELHVRCWASQYKRDTDVLARAHECNTELGASVIQGKNERAGTFQLEEEMGQRDLINV